MTTALTQTTKRTDNNCMQSSFHGEPIALIGIACEFASGIHSPVDLWQALIESRDLGSEISKTRTDLTSYTAHMMNQDTNGDFAKSLIRRGYFMEESLLDTFDSSFFGLSDGESATIDPCHRLLMLKFVHLLDDAGYPIEKVRGSRTSVTIGQFSIEHTIHTNRLKPEHRTRFHGPNSLLYNASARLSYHFDLRGPNLSVDGACSSSLQAVHIAVQALRSGEADMAVCGGVNALYRPESFHFASMIGAVSPDGRSRAFSSDANGYAKSEGLGLVLLKRLSDAERDGDRIYCVIRDALSNHDGCELKSGYVVPSSAGQKRILNDIYGRTKYDLQRIFYVEAHGTGTQVGDPIEANTLGQFFGRSSLDPPLLIGSIKTNVGHTEGTAGIAALIKVAMCMRNRAIPPNMHFTALNPKIEAKHLNIHIVQNVVPFPSSLVHDGEQVPISIGINSFGMGGNNAHLIVEEYRQSRSLSKMNGHVEKKRLKQKFLFLFSSKSLESLRKQVNEFNQWLQHMSADEKYDDEHSFLASVSQQLLLKRTISYEHLVSFVSSDRAQLQQQIEVFLAEQSSPGLLVIKRSHALTDYRRICFVFSGQGPQWWAMGRQLYESEPVFHQWIQRIDAEFAKNNGSEWRLLDELISKNEHESRINDTNIAQPALFAIQVALAALLVSWHVFPSAIVSHSAGEQAAAFVSGRVTLEEAVRIVYHRSRLQHRNTRQGGRMLAIAMSEQEARDKLLGDIEHLACVAVVNSSRSVTLSGEAATIEELEQILTAFYPDIFKARLRIENAFHSHQMDRFDIQKDMLLSLSDIRGLPVTNSQQIFDSICAQAHLYSSVLGDRVDDATPLNANYWWSNVRQCVRFGDAIQAIIRDKAVDTFLELSPHPVLATSIRECCEDAKYQSLILPTLKRKEDDQTTLLLSLSQLTHSPVVWHHYLASRSAQPNEYDDEGRLFDTFPLYTFNKQPCWYDSKESAIERLALSRISHPLLGIRQWTQETTSIIWKSLINLNLPEHAFLKDHKIQDAILFPAGGFLELALAACSEMQPPTSIDQTPQPIALEQIEFVKALLLTENELTEIFTQIVMSTREWFVYSRPWSSAGQDCMRPSGMNCNDVIESFTDPQTLNRYLLREFTLNARGRFDIGPHLTIKTSAMPLSPSEFFSEEILASCSSLDNSDAFYSYTASRGYQYGPCFQMTQSIKASTSKIVGQVHIKELFGTEHYHIHPAIIDASTHPSILGLSGNGTFLPATMGKVIVFGRTNVNGTLQNLTNFTTFHPKVIGIPQEHNYTVDMSVCDDNGKPFIIFESFTTQPVASRWLSKDKSVFDKVNGQAYSPNSDLTPHIDTILAEYCLEKKWSLNEIKARNFSVYLLPSPETLLEQVERLKSNDHQIDKQLENSIDELNKLTAYYAINALRHLTSSQENVYTLINDEVEQYVRNDEPHYRLLLTAIQSLVRQRQDFCEEHVTSHSIQLVRKQILDRYPLLRPLLVVLGLIGSRLSQILSGHQNVIDFLFDQSNERAVHEMQTLFCTTPTELVFQALTSYLKEQSHLSTVTNPGCLRVFIIGAGSSSTALIILHQLIQLVQEIDTDEILVEVIYTDLTTTLLDEAEQTLKPVLLNKGERVRVTYCIFDFEYEDNTTEYDKDMSVDIIFAANQLHLMENRARSINRLNRLLVPGGLLLLVELTHAHAYFDLLFGLFNYWWREDGIDGRALLTASNWSQVIRESNGWNIVTTSSKVKPFGYSLIAAQKTTSPLLSTINMTQQSEREAWLLFADRSYGLCQALTSLLPSSNVVMLFDESEMASIQSTIETMMENFEQLHIIFAWPLEDKMHALGESLNDTNESVFKWQEEHLCGTFVHILQSIQSVLSTRLDRSTYPYIFVLTRNAQAIVLDDINEFQTGVAPLIGLVRGLTAEYTRYHIKLIDLQTVTGMSDPLLVHVLIDHMMRSRLAENLDEIVLRQNEKNGHVTRLEWQYKILQPDIRRDELSNSVTIVPRQDADQNPFRLQIAPSGVLADMEWIKDLAVSKKLILPEYVEVRVHCVGLNFRDALKARGLYPYTCDFDQLNKTEAEDNQSSEPGTDFIGTIIHLSPSTSSHLRIGDRVVGYCMKGAFHSHLIVHACEVARVPDNCKHLSDEQLATLPTPFMTALYALKDRVQLRSDQTVLIHAAASPIGQACIQYCQAIGVRIIATASTDEKRHYLREKYNLEHVFNSRNLSFVSHVRQLMPKGVDIIVNFLAGPLLHESVKLLATHGHFIELGKQDIFDNSKIALFDLRADCSFHIIDLVSLSQIKEIGTLLTTMLDYVIRGLFKPIEPMTIFESSQVVEAFTHCEQTLLMDKMVLRLTSSERPLCLKIPLITTIDEDSAMFPPVVCNSGTILISGGFGGVGLSMSQWMIEKRGVKRLILMSRRTLAQFERSDDNPQLTDWLRLKRIAITHGAHVDVVQIDVTKFNDVRNLVERLSQTEYPVRGIIHSAGIFQNSTLSKLTQDLVTHIMAPKVRGAWNIHHACQITRAPLHFFILFSSISNHFIKLATSVYNAGNEFVENLAYYRSKKLGLPALTVSLPAVSDTGMFHREKDRVMSLKHMDVLESLPPMPTIEIVERLFARQRQCPSPIIFAVNWQKLAKHKDHLLTFQLTKIVEQQQQMLDATSVSYATGDTENGDKMTQSMTNMETILERIQVAVARLLGTTSIDRIDVNQSLLSQGMDSLAAVSLYNWLSQEWGPSIQLATLLQGVSIQMIANQTYKKLTEQKAGTTAVLSETTEMIKFESSDTDSTLINDKTRDTIVPYTGMNHAIYIIRGSDSNASPVFGILDSNLFDKKLIQSSGRKANICILHVPPGSTISTRASETIAQMRRIQPRGPYSLLAVGDDLVAREMVKQLEHHKQAGVTKFSCVASLKDI